MAKKHKREAAARARVARWPMAALPHHISDWVATESITTTPAAMPSSETHPAKGTEDFPIELDLDCGYMGGVSFQYSESDDDNTSCIESDGDSDSEDDESVCELKGDELEQNLETLRARLCVEEGVRSDLKSGLEQIAEVKTSTEWKKFEKARGLGYNGHSERT
ncbi:hypothetical protein BU15DRAFT_11535, partial [Melanogaster broomeanus]